MADGDSVTLDGPPVTPGGPTQAQEQDVDAQLKGKPDQGTANRPPPQDQPKKPESEQGDPMLQEGLRIYERDRARYDEANAQYERMHGEISDLNKRLLEEQKTNPTPPTPRPYPEQPDPAKQKATVGNLFGQLISIIAIGSVVFGKHRGAYGRANASLAAGSFLNAFAKGQREQGKEQLQNWNKSVELTNKLNTEDRQSYNEILANKRLDLAQQHQLLADVAAQRQDAGMYAAATSRDLNQVMKVMSNQLKAQVAFTKAQHSVNQTAMDNWMNKTGQGRTWAAYVQSKTGVDPHKDYDSFLKANKEYPASKWIDDHTKNQSGSGEAEKPNLSPGTKKTMSGETLATDTPLTPQEAKAMLKPGDWFEGTNHRFYQIPPQ